MKSRTVVAKAAALLSFVALLACYVAYESGVFRHFPDTRQSGVALAGMNRTAPDSTKVQREADSLAEKRRQDSAYWYLAGSKSMIRVVKPGMFSDVDTLHPDSTAPRNVRADSNKKVIRYMGSPKSRVIFQPTTGTTTVDTAKKQNNTP